MNGQMEDAIRSDQCKVEIHEMDSNGNGGCFDKKEVCLKYSNQSHLTTSRVHQSGGISESNVDQSPLKTNHVDQSLQAIDKARSTLVFTDIGVTLKRKQILKKVSGCVKIGDLLAIMGPSGAGKSTLLNAVAGRVPYNEGLIAINGRPVSRHLRRQISYVQQHDIFYPELTLEETMTFATLLRLPEKMSHQSKMQVMNEILEGLELTKCMKTKMGGSLAGGLSSGERKRVSIASELLTNPELLILDEPTTGLDSSIAFSLMSILAKYCRESHKTVVTTIHQPSTQIFHMFANVLLLTDGQVAYFGKREKILDFFGSLHLYCNPQYNPADFILEQIKLGSPSTEKVIAAAYALRETDLWPAELKSASVHVPASEHSYQNKAFEAASDDVINNNNNNTMNNRNDEVNKSGQKTSSEAHLNSVVAHHPSQKDALQPGAQSRAHPSSASSVAEDAKWRTGFLLQYSVLVKRSFLRSRDRYLSISTTVQILFMAVFIGLEWFQSAIAEETAKDRIGILFFISTQMTFFSMTYSIFAINDEHGVFARERSCGIYRLSAYYLATLTSEMPPVICLATVYTVIVYWMTGLTSSPANFFTCWIVMMLLVLSAQGLGILIGVVIVSKPLAVTFLQTFVIGSILAAGFYNTHIPAWFRWSKYVSIIGYPFSALSVNEFKYGDPLSCAPPNITTFPDVCGPNKNATHFSGELYLESIDMTTIPIYAGVIFLVAMIIISRIVAYVVLRYFRQPHA